jgi:hypothetical protein
MDCFASLAMTKDQGDAGEEEELGEGEAAGDDGGVGKAVGEEADEEGEGRRGF